MAVANMELLERAIQREASGTITAGKGEAQQQQVIIQFGGAAPKTPEGIWVRFHHEEGRLVQRLIDAGQPVDIWFQNDASMVQFSAKLLKKRLGLSGTLLLLEWPAAISIVDERKQPRWPVPAGFQLAARIQVLTPQRQVEFERSAKMFDIGLEGASLVCPSDKQFAEKVMHAWLNVVLVRGGRENGYLARFCHMTRASEQTMRMGVRFIPSGDPATASATEALLRLVSEVKKASGGDGHSKPAKNAA